MPKKPIKLHPGYQKQIRDKSRFTILQQGWGKGLVDRPLFVAKMLHPRFWPNWLAIFLLWLLVTFLPYPLMMLIGRRLGRMLGSFSASRKYVLNRNLELAFPEMSPEQRHALSVRIRESSGQAVFETGMAWFWSDRRLLRHVSIDPRERARALELARSGRPILVLTCHFFHLEIMARAYALLIAPGIGVYRPTDHPIWEWLQVHGRLRSNLALVDRRDPRSMIKALRRNLPIWYAPDQDYGAAASVFVPFFGVDKAATVVGTHTLARVKGTVVQPSWTVRENGKYVLRVLPGLENFPTGDAVADTLTVNRTLERMILTAPEQYLWLHRRFKTVPPGEKERYPMISQVE